MAFLEMSQLGYPLVSPVYGKPGEAGVTVYSKSPEGGSTPFYEAPSYVGPKPAPKATTWVSDEPGVVYHGEAPGKVGIQSAETVEKEESVWASFAKGAKTYKPGSILSAASATKIQSGYTPGASMTEILSAKTGVSQETTRTILRYGLGIAAGAVALWGVSRLVKAWKE